MYQGDLRSLRAQSENRRELSGGAPVGEHRSVSLVVFRRADEGTRRNGGRGRRVEGEQSYAKLKN